MRRFGSLFSALVVAAACCHTSAAWAQDPAESPTEERSYHDCVVVLLDASGSMKDRMGGSSQTKMAAAKAALKQVLAQVPPSTQVGVLVFSGRFVPSPWIWSLGPRRDDAELAQAIDPIRPAGGTPLGAFIKRAADRLLEERARQFGYGSYRLLVVTDGEASDANLVRSFAPDVVARGITMDVIGVDMRQDHTLANLAHSYRRADDPQSLRSAVAEVFAEVSAGASGAGQAAGLADQAFESIEGLPSELALAMLSALGSSGNHAIGEQPRAEAGRAADAPETGQPPPAGQQKSTAPAPAPESSRGDRGTYRLSRWQIIVIFAVLFVLYLVVRKKLKGR